MIDEKKVFVDLFYIYEQELLDIFKYITPITNICDKKGCGCGCRINLNVSGNKIHELHLRVSAECENLMKRVANKLFPGENFDEKYLEKKIKGIGDILKNLSFEDAEIIKENLYKYADMPFYFKILDERLGLVHKKIEFSRIVEISSEKQIFYIQPFEKNDEKKYLPIWWNHYNAIKHYKIENYTDCTLRDLINSLGAYYMLLNYFVLNLDSSVVEEEIIESKIYKLTVGWVDYPLELFSDYGYYRENNAHFFKNIYVGSIRVIPGYYGEETMGMVQKEIDKSHKSIHLKDIKTNVHSNLKNENYYFYNSLVQQQVFVVGGYLFDGKMRQSGWMLKMEKRFNYYK